MTEQEKQIKRLQSLAAKPPKNPDQILRWANEILQVTSQIYGAEWTYQRAKALNEEAEAQWLKRKGTSSKGR